MASKIRIFVLVLVFTKPLGKIDFFALTKFKFPNLAKFDFLDLANFVMVDGFLILSSILPPPVLSPILDVS